MPPTIVTQPADVTVWQGCTGTEKVVTLPDTGKNVAVRIPAGIKDGQNIRITNGAQSYLVPVHLTKDGIHTLEDDGTLRRQLTIPAHDMRSGGQINLTTPYGPINLEIPKNSTGEVAWTIQRWGYPRTIDPGTRGNLIVTATSAEEGRKKTPTSPSAGSREAKESTALGCLQAIAGIALIAAVIYGLPFFIYPIGYALVDGETDLAIDIAKWNLTHFPGSQGPKVRCIRDDLNTPGAREIKQRTFEIGKALEREHGYDMVDHTSVAVVDFLGGNAGMTHYGGAENCIQILVQGYDLENTIRHEWAHIAAARLTENAAHGPKWREIATAFGARTARFAHCTTGDSNCQPRD